RRQRRHRSRCAPLVERGRHAGRRERAVMITVERLTKRHRARRAVSDVTFLSEPGTITGFLGPNGAGKTTTMRMLVGLSEPDSGEARILGGGHRQRPQPPPARAALPDAP